MRGLCTIPLALQIALALMSSMFNAEVTYATKIFGCHTKKAIAFSVDKNSLLLSKSNGVDLAGSSGLHVATRTFRGGANQLTDDEEEYDEEDEEDEVAVDRTKSGSSSSTALSSVGGILHSISKAIMRAVSAASKSVGSGGCKDENASFVGKVVQTIRDMVAAALNPKYDNNRNFDGENEEETDEDEGPNSASSATEAQTLTIDLGSYLAKAYGVRDGRKNAKDSPVLGGSLNEALRIARSSAKLLLVLIPASAPTKSKKNDSQAITSFLSAEVAKVAKKKARKKGDTASYILWSAKAGSSEATTAMKRLKVKATGSKGDKRPILLVAYPAQVSKYSGKEFGLST